MNAYTVSGKVNIQGMNDISLLKPIWNKLQIEVQLTLRYKVSPLP